MSVSFRRVAGWFEAVEGFTGFCNSGMLFANDERRHRRPRPNAGDALDSFREGSKMQVMWTVIDGEIKQLDLPDPADQVLPGIFWGAFDQVSTPAYWAGQAWQHELLRTYENLRLGRSLAEELAACLLGGYGMPAALGLKAYERVRALGLLSMKPSGAALEAVLSEPFEIDGRKWAYRFPHQKARYLSESLRLLEEVDPITDDVTLRNQLTQLPGVGMKTASWIVRNIRNSNYVAIIDVHILRAGRAIGLFNPILTPEKDYVALENDFLVFADALGARASRLDGLIWSYLRANRAASKQCRLFD